MVGIDLPIIGRKSKALRKNFYFIDFFNFYPLPCGVKSKTFTELYEKYKLSTKQIAERIGVSKTTVLTKLKKSGISSRGTSESLTHPENYRSSNPPFGFRVIDGRLVENKQEIRICRKVIRMKNEGLSFSAISHHLVKEGIKNRKKTTYWCHKQIKRIYNYWKGKL